MIKGFYPNQWLPKSQTRLTREKTAVATIGVVATISQNTGATYSGCSLATILEGSATSNFNPGGHFNTGHEVGSFSVGNRQHVLIDVSGLSNITSGTVVSATFDLPVNPQQVTGTFNIVLRKMLVASDVTQVTWNNRLTASAWGTAGCLSDGVDREPTIIGRGVITAATTGTVQISGSGLNQAVQNLINGTSTVFWFELEHVNDVAYDATAARFISQSQTDGQRPVLTVVYTIPTNTDVNVVLSAFFKVCCVKPN